MIPCGQSESQRQVAQRIAGINDTTGNGRTPDMAWLEIDEVSKSYNGRIVLRELQLEVSQGEKLVLLGASGSGKSTLLRILAGIEPFERGRIHMDGRELAGVKPHLRNIGFVLQSGGYFDSLTVRQNLESSLRSTALSAREKESQMRWVAGLLDIESCFDRNANQLSGGELQRLVLGRVLVRRPKLLMFDEPLNQLDSSLRFQLRQDIARWSREIEATCLYVTHDAAEAMQMGDRIGVLADGQIQQLDRPEAVYRLPQTIEIAKLIGTLPPACFEAQSTPWKIHDQATHYLCRPEQWDVRPESLTDRQLIEDSQRIEIQVSLTSKSFQATCWLLQTQATDGRIVYALASSEQARSLAMGQVIYLSVPRNDVGCYGQNGRRLS